MPDDRILPPPEFAPLLPTVDLRKRRDDAISRLRQILRSTPASRGEL